MRHLCIPYDIHTYMSCFGVVFDVISFVEVVGLLCETTNQIVALRVANRSAHCLKPIFDDFAPNVQLVKTDQWSGYGFLRANGWNHVAVNHYV